MPSATLSGIAGQGKFKFSNSREGSSVGRRDENEGHAGVSGEAPLRRRRMAVIRDLATDIPKRELFSRLAEHFSLLASVVEIESCEPPVSGT
jgi:hypothetical protein